jgi:protein-S-isoprenylcysteine O-methyltransferase Ste14
MNSLELKVPPPVVLVLTSLGMWGLAHWPPHWSMDQYWRIVLFIGLAMLGVSCATAGVVAFVGAKTTISPIHPERASQLVQTGIYRYTRNPMYVGLLFVLTGWAMYLQSSLALLGLVFFVIWITRFQIVPEERLLLKLFGEEYRRYCERVRRWG